MACVSVESISTVRRWSMLAIALSATLCANVFINGAAFLIPTLHTERGLDLAQAGLLSSMPSFGMVATLIAWGYIVDRVGERIVLALGSALTAAAAFASGVGGLARRGRCVAAAWRHGGGEQQFGQRPTGGRMVSAGATRSGDGHPSDRAAAGSRIGRLGDSAARGKPRRLGGPLVPRGGVRGVGGGVRGRGDRPAAAAAARGRRSRSGQPVPRIVGVVAHPCRVGACWWFRRWWCGRSRWCG